MSPELTYGGYQRTLSKFYGFYAPWEARLDESGSEPLCSFFADRRKVQHLGKDLAYFNVKASREPLCPAVPEFPSLAAQLGSLYVIEGATLGGQIIFRHLQHTLGLGAETGARFFYGYGTQTAEKWTAFENFLQRHAMPDQADLTVEAARDTFEALYDWMREKT